MQSTVSCDRVFDVLTRQPFPSGADDDPTIEEHIRSCHECRQLAEALRPALNLLHESLADQPTIGWNRIDALRDSGNDLPSYSGLSTQSIDAISGKNDEAAVGQIMERVHEAANDLKSSDMNRTTWNSGSLIGLACLAATILMMFVASQPVANGSEDLANNAERFQYLAAGGVPVGCLANVGWHHPAILLQENNAAAEACCTDCHNGKQPLENPMDQFKPLAQSCQACHDMEVP